jgi:hypothetical protein
MYLRRCYRQKDGKRHGYWALVESYRSHFSTWASVMFATVALTKRSNTRLQSARSSSAISEQRALRPVNSASAG